MNSIFDIPPTSSGEKEDTHRRNMIMAIVGASIVFLLLLFIIFVILISRSGKHASQPMYYPTYGTAF